MGISCRLGRPLSSDGNCRLAGLYFRKSGPETCACTVCGTAGGQRAVADPVFPSGCGAGGAGRPGAAVVSGIPYPEGILSHINAGWDVHDSLSAVDILRLLSESVCCTVSYIKRPKKGYPDRNRKGGQII